MPPFILHSSVATGYCHICCRDFVSLHALDQHMQASSRHAFCLRCERLFVSRSALQQHIYASSNHHVCHDCPPTTEFNNRANLNSHMKLAHHRCVRCGDVFFDDEDLTDHSVNEHNMCELCERHFLSPSNLNSHRVTHEPRDKECFGCDRAFSSWSAMMLHMEYDGCPAINVDDAASLFFDCTASEPFQGDRPGEFACATCGALFTLLSGLLQHAESYSCDETITYGSLLDDCLMFMYQNMPV